jgi:hypothetical protein
MCTCNLTYTYDKMFMRVKTFLSQAHLMLPKCMRALFALWARVLPVCMHLVRGKQQIRTFVRNLTNRLAM